MDGQSEELQENSVKLETILGGNGTPEGVGVGELSVNIHCR